MTDTTINEAPVGGSRYRNRTSRSTLRKKKRRRQRGRQVDGSG